MITVTRSQVRRLRAVFRRSTLGIHHRGIVSELVLRTDGGQLRAHHRYVDLAVESVESGHPGPAASVAIPLDALADFEGAADSPVVLEPAAPDRTVVRWDDRGIPQSREYDLVTPLDRIEPMPAPPTTWATNPAGLLEALAEACETSTDDSTRYALNCIQLRGGRGQVVATDGRQLFACSGFEFPWTEDILIRARPVFACRAFPRDRPVEVGHTETHVFFRVGAWTVSCVVHREARFPSAERVIPAPAEVGTNLRLDAAEARFLESALGRLPGAEAINHPVTVNLNGEVAVWASPAEHPERVTELVLRRSAYVGTPISVCTNRVLLERLLRLGFNEIGFTGAETPFVCRDNGRVYAVQPLSEASPPPAGAEVTRIESGAAEGGERRAPEAPEETRRTTTVRESSRNGHEPASSAVCSNHPSARPAEAPGATGPESPGTSLAALLQEAEALHASLAEARSRTARLIAGLRRQRKQSRLVSETLRSLRHLKLQDVVA